MFSFLPPLLIIIGLVGLILLLNQQQPRKSNKFLQKLFLPFKRGKKQSRLQSQSLILTERLLVYSRIIILKLDRFLSNSLSRLRKKRILQKEQKKKLFSSPLISLNRNKKALSSLGTDFLKEEKKLLYRLEKFPDEGETLMNLARIYLWKGDFSSARAILLSAYRKDKENRVTQTLLVELEEKEANTKIPDSRNP